MLLSIAFFKVLVEGKSPWTSSFINIHEQILTKQKILTINVRIIDVLLCIYMYKLGTVTLSSTTKSPGRDSISFNFFLIVLYNYIGYPN